MVTTFMRFFKVELKRFARKRNLSILIIFFLISLLFIHYGAGDFNGIMKSRESFKELEKNTVKQFLNYTQYGSYGFRLLFVPARAAVLFFNSTVLPETLSFVDSGIRLNIFSPLKGKNAFLIKKSFITSFGGVLLFLGGLLVILYGFEGVLAREYIMMLSSLSSLQRVFAFMFISRLLILCAVLLVLFSCAYLLAALNGIMLPLNTPILVYIAIAFGLMIFFLLLGMLAGTMKSKFAGFTTAILICLVLVFFIPISINIYIAEKSKNITPLDTHEVEKLKVAMDFEKRAIEKRITYKYGEKLTDDVKDMMVIYKDEVLPLIQEMEKRLLGEVKELVRNYHFLSMFFPTSFYITVGEESSSRGYLSLAAFHEYTAKLKKEFFEFYMQKLYFEPGTAGASFTEVELFIKNNENLYQAVSHLPHTVAWGFLLTLAYSLALLFSSFLNLKKITFHTNVPGKRNIVPCKFSLQKGTKNAYRQVDPIMSRVMYSILSGFAGKITHRGKPATLEFKVDNRDLAQLNKKESEPFVYLCHPGLIPQEIPAVDLMSLLNNLLGLSAEEEAKIKYEYLSNEDLKLRLEQLENYQQGELLLSILSYKKRDIYFIDKTAEAMPLEIHNQLITFMENLSSQGAFVLYFYKSKDPETMGRIGDIHLITKASENWFKLIELENRYQPKKNKINKTK